jgi:hypothetical protein
MAIQELNIFFCGFYFLTRFVPIMSGKFVWMDGKPFTFDQQIMQMHNIFGLLLHILAIPLCVTGKPGNIENGSITLLWNTIIISNVLIMNVAGIYSPHSRKLSGFAHWAVSIVLSVITLSGIWNPLYLMRLLWALDCFSFLVYFN